MPQFSIGRLTELDPGFVLAPERYDPRTNTRNVGSDSGKYRLFDLVELRRDTMTRSSADRAARYVVLDTGDAREGMLTVANPLGGSAECIGSAKKLVHAGDVLISRLRPYLRQVAYVDGGATLPGVSLLCSTEFYVLRPLENLSLAFLVPFLLSETVQSILAAAQEGGHHPRFSDRVLLNLPIPDLLLQRRSEISENIEARIRASRAFDSYMASIRSELDDAMKKEKAN